VNKLRNPKKDVGVRILSGVPVDDNLIRFSRGSSESPRWVVLVVSGVGVGFDLNCIIKGWNCWVSCLRIWELALTRW